MPRFLGLAVVGCLTTCMAARAPADPPVFETSSRGWRDTLTPVQRTGYQQRTSLAQVTVAVPAGVSTADVTVISTLLGLYPDEAYVLCEFADGTATAVFALADDTPRTVAVTVPGSGDRTFTITDGTSFLSGGEVLGTWLVGAEAATPLRTVRGSAPTHRLAVYGDSISEGFGATRSVDQGAYALIRRNSRWAVTTIGYGSRALHDDANDIPGLAGQIASACDGTVANTIFLQVGLNDCVLDLWTPTEFCEAYTELLVELRARRPLDRIVAYQFWPVSDEGVNGLDFTRQDYRDAIADAVTAADANVELVNGAAVTGITLADGTHPNTAGYAVGGRALLTVIDPEMQPYAYGPTSALNNLRTAQGAGLVDIPDGCTVFIAWFNTAAPGVGQEPLFTYCTGAFNNGAATGYEFGYFSDSDQGQRYWFRMPSSYVQMDPLAPGVGPHAMAIHFNSGTVDFVTGGGAVASEAIGAYTPAAATARFEVLSESQHSGGTGRYSPNLGLQVLMVFPPSQTFTTEELQRMTRPGWIWQAHTTGPGGQVPSLLIDARNEIVDHVLVTGGTAPITLIETGEVLRRAR